MASPKELTSLIFAVGRLLRERTMADGSTISYLHLATLRYVAEKKQPLMREIAQYLRVAPPSATSLVNTLVKQGEIRRIADEKDRRTVRLEVTARGHKTLSDGAHRKQDLVHTIIKGLSEHDRTELKNILKKIMNLSIEK